MKRNIWLAVISTIIVFAGFVGGAYYYYKTHTAKPISESWPAISWRAQIILKKALGEIPELSWAELIRMTADEHGFGLSHVIVWGQSVDATLTSPYTSHEDMEAAGHVVP